MRWWYLRRALPWAALAGCGTVAAVLTAAVHRWPGTSDLLLPYALASCAAMSGFLLDEVAAPVVRVTARGGSWRVLARLGALLLPVGVWVGIVAGLPDGATTQPETLVLAGVAGCLLGGGAAAALATAGVREPGTHLASAFVGATTVPFVLGSFLGWQPVVPVGEVADWVPGFWAGVALVAVACAAAGLRRTP